ncbi:hydroxypyruvate reductase [Sulfitobacter marinus]|uniref:Hydroxypyruvate reductase n=1 Tax=Sulfitobacter marinus TaxID=394264 RepID=A0A1I6VAP3_9RHOB|nr:glycerate kinase [Sulfitobacter marinus]SFT10695.1 hydroxypyruvate reductase [Sulfitobacter marinus]
MASIDPETLLRDLFDVAVEVADPMQSLARFLPPRPAGRVVVIGAGKASARMAEAVEAEWGPCEGLVITRYGYARLCQGIEIVEAAHPVPDQAGVTATKRMIALMEGLGDEDFVLALISGGASSLLVAPLGEITLSEKQAVNQGLLASGAPIQKMNVVRKHLSRVKGGQLAAAVYPARMLTLMISDVPGDDMAMIGSGPTVGDASTAADALAILEDWDISVPPSVSAALAQGSQVIAPGDLRLSRVTNQIYAAPKQSLDAAEARARSLGFDVVRLGNDLEGEARDVAKEHAQLALATQAKLMPGDPPVVILSGGELTVTRRGDGNGGPNAEYCLALALALNSAPNLWALACDTDGVDGGDEVAGARIGPNTLKKAENLSVDPDKSLIENDSHEFFMQIGGQIVTGPTLTNVNDFRAILVYPITS